MDRYLSGRNTRFCKILLPDPQSTGVYSTYTIATFGKVLPILMYPELIFVEAYGTYRSPFFHLRGHWSHPPFCMLSALLTGREVTLLTDNEPWYMGGQRARSHDTSAPIFAGPAYHCGIPRCVCRSPRNLPRISTQSAELTDSLSRSKTTLDCHKERSNPPPSKILRALLDWLNNQLASLWLQCTRLIPVSDLLKSINQPQFQMLCYQCINCSLNSYLYRYQILRTNYPGAPPQHPQLLAIFHALSLPIPGYRTPRSTPPPLRRLRRTVQYVPQRQFSM